MKRMICFLLILCMTAALLPGAVLGAGQGITLTAASSQLTAGSGSQTVSVPITLSGNTGLLGLQFQVHYSSQLKLQKVDTTGSVMKNLTFTQPGDLSANPVTLAWDGMDRTDNGNGIVVTLVFSVPRTTAAVHDIILVPTVSGCYDYDMDDVPAFAVNGQVTVKGTSSTTPVIHAATVVSREGQRTQYASLERALEAAPAKSTVELAENTRADRIVLPHNVSLDLNGHKLTVGTALFAFGQVKDSSDGSGLLVLGGAFCRLPQDNVQLPLFDNTSAGYRFFSYRLVSVACTGIDRGANFEMKLEFDQAEAYRILSRSVSSVKVTADLGWTGAARARRLEFGGAALRDHVSAQGARTLNITLTGIEKLQKGTILAVRPRIETELGVTGGSLTMRYVVV